MQDTINQAPNIPVKTMLKHALKLIEKHQNWTKRTFARNNLGETVFPNDVSACRWCMTGALERARFDLGGVYEDEKKARDHLEQQCQLSVSYLNDNSKHKDVVKFLRKAIKKVNSFPEDSFH